MKLLNKVLIIAILLCSSITYAAVPLLSEYPEFSFLETKKKYIVKIEFIDDMSLIGAIMAVNAFNEQVGKEFLKIVSPSSKKKANITISEIPLSPFIAGIAVPREQGACTIFANDMLLFKPAGLFMHEIGHCLGLAHIEPTADNCRKLMYPGLECALEDLVIEPETLNYLKEKIL